MEKYVRKQIQKLFKIKLGHIARKGLEKARERGNEERKKERREGKKYDKERRRAEAP